MEILRFLVFISVICGCGFAVKAQKNVSVLTGIVYDVAGARIPQIPITAIDQTGDRFETLTDDAGVYTLILPYRQYKSELYFEVTKYQITFIGENRGFRNITTNINFVHSLDKGKMNLDVVLEILVFENCGVGGCLPDGLPIESPDLEVFHNISPQPLVDLPRNPALRPGI